MKKIFLVAIILLSCRKEAVGSYLEEMPQVAFTSDSKEILLNYRSTATAYTVADAVPRKDFSLEKIFPGDTISSLAVSPDGKYCAFILYSGKIALFDYQKQILINTLTCAENNLSASIFSDDSTLIITTALNDQKKLFRKNIFSNSGKEILLDCDLASLSGDGKIFSCLNKSDKNIVIRDTENFDTLANFSSEEFSSATDVTLSHDGKLSCIVSSEKVSVFSSENGDSISSKKGNYFTSAIFTGDSTIIIFGNGGLERNFYSGQEQNLSWHSLRKGVSVSPDGKILASTVQFGSGACGGMPVIYDRFELFHLTPFYSLEFSVGHYQSKEKYSTISRATFSSNNKYYATTDTRGTSIIWRASDSRKMWSRKNFGGNFVFSSDGEFLYVSSNAKIEKYDWKKDSVVENFPTTSLLNYLQISFDGKFLLGYSERKIFLLNIASRSVEREFEIDSSGIKMYRLSRDGNFLLTASNRGQVDFWNALSGEKISSSVIAEYLQNKMDIQDISPGLENIAILEGSSAKLWSRIEEKFIQQLGSYEPASTRFILDGQAVVIDFLAPVYNISYVRKIGSGNTYCFEQYQYDESNSYYHPERFISPDGDWQLRVDGCSVYFSYYKVCNEVTSAEENFSENTFSISPNPANDKIRISLNQKDLYEEFSVKIFDEMGKEILSPKNILSGDSSLFLEVPNLENGVYFCRISSGKFSRTIAFIVAR